MPKEFYAAIREAIARNGKVAARVGWRTATGYCEAQVFPEDLKKAKANA